MGAKPELCRSGAYRRSQTPSSPWSGDTLAAELRPHLPPSPVRARGSCTAPSRSAVPPHTGEATVAPPRSPAGIRRISEDDGEKMPANSPIERLHVAPPRDTLTPLPIFSFRAISVGPAKSTKMMFQCRLSCVGRIGSHRFLRRVKCSSAAR